MRFVNVPRRRSRWISGALRVAGLWALLSPVLPGIPAAAVEVKEAEPVRMSRYLMGTVFDVVVYDVSPDRARTGIKEAFREMARLEEVMSHYREGSELMRLVREAPRSPRPVSRDLFEVLERALYFSRLSQGRFDVTVGATVRLWRRAQREGELPDPVELEAARSCAGFEKLILEPPNRVGFRSSCLELDLGGIGKGFAVERGLERLRSAGIRNALINAGGSTVAAFGAPPGGRAWEVVLPVSGPHESKVVKLHDASLSTSGATTATGRFSTSGIVEPSTGALVRKGGSVAVIAPRAADSDALATAILLLGYEEGRRALEAHGRATALWWTDGGSVRAHPPEFGRLGRWEGSP